MQTMDGDLVVEPDASNGVSCEHNKQYIEELINERQNLNPSFVHAAKLLDLEISQAQIGQEKAKLLELHNDKPTKVVLKVKVPANEFPKFNFIGKIIGPKGNSLRRIQDETGCRMAVFGRGSMRDKEKEEECRVQGGKYSHLNEELHVHVESFGHPVDVYRKLSFALHELRRHLVPDYNDDVTQQQVHELAILNGAPPPGANRGRGRGGMPMSRGAGPVVPPYGARGGGASFGIGASRGSRGGRGFPTRGASTFKPRGGPQHPPQPQPQQPMPAAGYSESSQYEQNQNSFSAGPSSHGYENQPPVNTTGPVQQFSEFSQSSVVQPAYNIQPNYTAQPGQAPFGSQNAVPPFNPQAAMGQSAAYDNPSANTWGSAPGAEVGSYGKSPVARPSVGMTRSHPYAPPTVRGGHF